MNEKKVPLTRWRSLPDMSEKEVLGAEAPECQKQQERVEHGGTIRFTIPSNLPKELSGIKATEDGNGHFSVRHIEKWIEGISGDVVCAQQDSWKELARLINGKNGRLAGIMLEKLTTFMKQEMGIVSKELPGENRENNFKRPFEEDNKIDYSKMSVAEQTLVEYDYTINDIRHAKEALLARGKDPATASAVEYIDALENDQDMRTTPTQEEQFSTSKKKKICKHCVETLHRCPEGCGHLIRSTEAAEL